MTELAILLRARVHAATGVWLSDDRAEEVAASWARNGIDFEVALAEVQRTLTLPQTELERLSQAFHELVKAYGDQ